VRRLTTWSFAMRELTFEEVSMISGAEVTAGGIVGSAVAGAVVWAVGGAGVAGVGAVPGALAGAVTGVASYVIFEVVKDLIDK
jgi:hypothetical protein